MLIFMSAFELQIKVDVKYNHDVIHTVPVNAIKFIFPIWFRNVFVFDNLFFFLVPVSYFICFWQLFHYFKA